LPARYIKELKKKMKNPEKLPKELPKGWIDWNELTLDQMVEHLRNKYMFSSSGDAKCIGSLIDFYEKNK